MPAQIGRGWHTTTFKWLSIYGVIFSLSFVLLAGFLGWSVTNRMQADSDGLLHWQMYYFESIPNEDMPLAILRRLENERMHVSYFGLFAADGTRIAGDIESLPRALKLDEGGHTLRDQLTVRGELTPAVVRAAGIRRPDGTILVIARDWTSLLHLREVAINALVTGGLFFLFVSIATGLLLSVRQMRRVRDIRRVTQRIAEGDLNQRLPIGGRDELDMLSHLVNHMLDDIERLMTEVKGACDGIAHDLRTPLSRIRMLLGNVTLNAQGNEDAQGLIDAARAETDRLLDRFRAMLRISEIESLKRRGGFASVNLGSLVAELDELYGPLAEERGMRWIVDVAPTDDVHGDRALMFEAFGNILDNAIKFTPQGGQVHVSLSMVSQGPKLVISDTGPGIPEWEREAVLTRFYRADKSRHVPGSGLGLSIVIAVMHIHDFVLRVGPNELSASTGTSMTVECWPHALD
ncbi:HAMP domain-containing sensor histidine kinase [Caballeronia sp. LZ034LL]|uniref:sensor histidine kinase n=1 Tax=Caballeronia sp. LZ034LL TaxID=3038567 RepID=UPI0028655B2A|nr:HAMP domain-containing sensor histidine kinase [Caballeronia sp. LZ034LL]MDR5835129.1 HAMP domain-containing sensor histidine kinase [Caballeronia sp. LZ034LL]